MFHRNRGFHRFRLTACSLVADCHSKKKQYYVNSEPRDVLARTNLVIQDMSATHGWN